MPGALMKPVLLFTLQRTWGIPALFLLMGMVISGCESAYVHFSGAAAMRVQVDVYKGPLADELPTQWANLSEVGNEFSLRLQQYNVDVRKDISVDDYCKDSILGALEESNAAENLGKIEILENLLTLQKASKSAETPQDEDDKKVLNSLTLDCYILIALNLDSKGLYEAAIKQYTVHEALEAIKDVQASIQSSQSIIESAQKVIANNQETVNSAKRSISNSEKIKNSENEVIAENQRIIQVAEEAIASSRSTIQEARKDIMNDQGIINSAQEAIMNNQRIINSSQEAIANSQNTIQEAQENIIKNQRIISFAHEAIMNAKRAIKEAKHAIAQSKRDIQEGKNAKSISQDKIEKEKAKITEGNKQIEEAKDIIATKRKEIKTAESITLSGLNRVSRLFERTNDFEQYDKICWGVNLTEAQRDSAYEGICNQVGKHLFVSAKARIASHYWSILSGIHYPNERRVRQQMASYANLTAQFSQELRYRADIILKQLDGLTKENASLALKLRNTSFNDFLNLYAWYRAADRPIPEELLSEGPYIFSAEQTRDRVRAMEMLYDYESWEKINEVHANGRGEFSLALIKDRIGNWRLKSYESDPSKLLAAYTKVGTTLLKSATSLAGKLAKGPASSVDLLNIKNMTTTGAKMVIATQASTNAEQDVTQDTTASDTASSTSSTQQSGAEVTPKMLFVAENSRKHANRTLGLLLDGFSKNSAVKEYRDLLKWEEIEKTIPSTCFENGMLKTKKDLNRFDLIECIGPIKRHKAEAEKYGPRSLEGQPKNLERTEIRKQYAAQLGQLFTSSQNQLQAHAKNIESLKP